MITIKRTLQVLCLTSALYSCTTEDPGIILPDNPDTSLEDDNSDNGSTGDDTVITANELFDATWDVTDSDIFTSITFTSNGLVTVNGEDSGSRMKNNISEDIIFFGEYTVDSDTEITLVDFGTLTISKNGDSISIKFVSEDNGESITVTASISDKVVTDRTKLLNNTWVADDLLMYFTTDGKYISDEGNGTWEWSTDNLIIADGEEEITIVSLTETELVLISDGETITFTVISKEEFLSHLYDEEVDNDDEDVATVTSLGKVQLDGEELFDIAQTDFWQYTYGNDNSGRLYDVLISDQPIENIEEWDDEQHDGYFIILDIATSNDNPTNLIGDYTHDAAYHDSNENVPNYSIINIGIYNGTNQTEVLSTFNDYTVNVQDFKISINEDGQYSISGTISGNGKTVTIDFDGPINITQE